MAQITLKEPEGPYSCIIDTEVMVVEIRNAFLGVNIISESGEVMCVSLRDGGFEVIHKNELEKI